MHPECGVGPAEWTTALVAALALHLALVVALGSTPLVTGTAADRDASARGEGAGRTLRLSLGAPAAPAQVRESAPAPAVPATRAPRRRDPAAAPPMPTASPAPAPEPAETRSVPEPAVVSGVGSEPGAPPVSGAAADAGGPEAGAEIAPSAAAGADGATGTDPPGSADAGASAVRLAEARSDYLGNIVRRVRDELDYPRRARLEGVEGTVVLAIRLDREGQLVRCEVVESSGSRELDRHAIRVARRAAPFGPVPPRLFDEETSWELPVDFVLRD